MKLSELKGNCREFEQYMAVNYDYEILKNKRPRSSDSIGHPDTFKVFTFKVIFHARLLTKVEIYRLKA